MLRAHVPHQCFYAGGRFAGSGEEGQVAKKEDNGATTLRASSIIQGRQATHPLAFHLPFPRPHSVLRSLPLQLSHSASLWTKIFKYPLGYWIPCFFLSIYRRHKRGRRRDRDLSRLFLFPFCCFGAGWEERSWVRRRARGIATITPSRYC